MSTVTKINGEVHFKRRVSNHKNSTSVMVVIIAYINYEKKTYIICQPSQEGVMYGKDNKGIDYDFAYNDLVKKALLYIKKELK